jgi:hypothetical protein
VTVDDAWVKKDVILHGHALKEQDPVLDRYPITDDHAILDVDMIANIAAIANPRACQHMSEGPDPRS